MRMKELYAARPAEIAQLAIAPRHRSHAALAASLPWPGYWQRGSRIIPRTAEYLRGLMSLMEVCVLKKKI